MLYFLITLIIEPVDNRQSLHRLKNWSTLCRQEKNIYSFYKHVLAIRILKNLSTNSTIKSMAAIDRNTNIFTNNRFKWFGCLSFSP